jgi:hypothetical protein
MYFPASQPKVSTASEAVQSRSEEITTSGIPCPDAIGATERTRGGATLATRCKKLNLPQKLYPVTRNVGAVNSAWFILGLLAVVFNSISLNIAFTS